MSENGTHIFLHHSIDGVYFGMVCCILLIVIALLLALLLGVVVYMYIRSKRSRQKTSKHSHPRFPDHRSFRNLMDDVSSYGIGTPAHRELASTDVRPDRRVSRVRPPPQTDEGSRDSSDSSGGMIDVLFPADSEGDILTRPPTKLVAFAGQVLASGEKGLPRDLPGPGPSTSGLQGEDASGASLEWDYFQHGSDIASEAESEVRYIQNICWV